MQETSSLYKRLIADPGHWKEYTLVIGESGALVTNQGDRITFGSELYSAEVRGSVIQLEGTTENPLTGLTIFGKTTQDGTPTPDDPVPLVSAGDGGSLGVKVAGKNLVDIKNPARGVNCTLSVSGEKLICKTTWQAWVISVFQIGDVKALKGKKLSIAMKNAGTVTCVIRFGYMAENGSISDDDSFSWNEIAAGNRGTATVTVPEDREGGKIGVALRFNATSIAVGTELTLENIQVELGTTATEYEPYKEPKTMTLSTPNGLPGIPVTSGGNYTDEAGQQWVCDEVDFGRGVYVQRVQEYVFKGKEPVTAPYWDSTGFCYSIGNYGMPKPTVGTETTKVLCNYLSGTNAIATNEMVYFRNIGSFSSQAEASTYLKGLYESGNPFTIQYVIATPIETPLSAEELAAYAALHTNYPNTTILNDGGADMIVGYLLNGGGPINILVASSSADSGFRESSIISMSTQKSIFSDSNPTVGNCIAGQITVEMMKPKGDIPRRARLAPYVRLTNGKEHSEWLQKGVFFIDHREYSNDENERMTVYGYDHIILAEDEFPSSTHTWPRKDIDVVRDIAIEIGTSLDRRTVQIMNKGYEINYPAGYSMREVLENIAAMYAGSFIMSDTGELLLVTMFGIPGETSYLIDSVGFAITFGGDRILV